MRTSFRFSTRAPAGGLSVARPAGDQTRLSALWKTPRRPFLPRFDKVIFSSAAGRRKSGSESPEAMVRKIKTPSVYGTEG
jgi:hypothetical protein